MARMPEKPVRVAAGDEGFEDRIRQMSERVHGRFRYHSIQLPDGSVLPGLQSIDHLRWRLGLFGLPEDLRGRRVLDIGAWDGWFSFECERRGAAVVAVDCVELDTFLEARQFLNSKVEYLTLDVNELSARRLGRFDIVLFFGVFYHLRHPLLGLEKAVEMSSDVALIESFVIPSEVRPVPAMMEFYERAELGGQVDNWCGPTPECLLSMARSAGFAEVELKDITNQRASVLCRRRWPEPSGVSAAPHLHSAVNNRTYVARFHPLKDEYICCYFKSERESLTPAAVQIEVDGYGVPCLTVVANGPGAYQANCLRPPGLEPGRHKVCIRTAGSGRSNTADFVMLDESGREGPSPPECFPVLAPELCSVEFQASGDLRIAVNRGGSLICYFRSPAESIGAPDVCIDAGGMIVQSHTIGSLGENVWQANVMLSEPIAAGTPVRLRLGEGEWSEPQPIRKIHA